ncbi:XRE family transcriptional regulator [Sphingobium yanoikuyae]|nr:helix-turn-helix domain-containing protein [Sphingobium yanoikuyae]
MGALHQIGAKGGMTIANNIAALREQRGWARPELAKRMGTSTQQVERLEKGQRGLTTDWIDKAARALGVPAGDIITPGAANSDDPLPHLLPDRLPTRGASDDDGTVDVIALDLSISMGPGTVVDDFVEQSPVKWDIGLLRVITRSPFHVLREVRGIGDSMEPTLRSADRVLIDTSEQMLSRVHGIYWIDHLGAHGLKRLRAAGQGRVLIMSDNPHVHDYEVAADELRIHGRAIWYGREL